MIARLLSALVGLIAAGLVVDLFFPWTEEGDDAGFTANAVDSVPGLVAFASGLALVLWEVVGVAGVRRTLRSDSLIAFMLAAGCALATIATLVHFKWTGRGEPFSADLAIAAFLAIPLSLALLGGAIAHLVFHVLAPPRSPAP